MLAPALDPERALDVVTSAARSGDADQLEVTLLTRAGEYTRFAGERIHQPQDITEVQLLVRAVVAGHSGRAATSDLTHVADTVRRAASLARDLAATGRPASGEVAAPSPDAVAPPLWHDDTAAFDAAARVALAGAAMRQAGAAGGVAYGMFGRAATQIAVATSAGVRRHAVATEASGSLTVTIDDGTSHWIDLHRSSDALGIVAAIGDTIARAAAGRGRDELPAGHYTVVLGPEAVGELLGFLDAFGFSGSLAAAGVGVCAQRAGERIAAPAITVADDALAPVGLPVPFDIEGTPKRRVPLLTGGVVGEPVTDLATARRLGAASTGHAHIAREEPPAPVAANAVLAAGDASEADLIAGVENGLYVERFWYTRLVDRTTGTITGVSRDGCFRIRDGALARPVHGARFTQSVLDFLATVDGVGDTIRSQPVMNVWNGAASAPAVRGHDFRFGVRP